MFVESMSIQSIEESSDVKLQLGIARTKTKSENRSKKCGVCGDVAKSFHFGGLACDSCKAFFRRSVQNDAHRMFRCCFRARCDITVANRKCCQLCRFNKCLGIGMETGWVMTEEERMDMLRSRMEKKRKQLDGRSDNAIGQRAMKKRKPDVVFHGPDSSEAADPMDLPPSSPLGNAEEEVERLTRTFSFCYLSKDEKGRVGHEEDWQKEHEPQWLLVLLFVVSIQKLVRFARGVRYFGSLSPDDQMGLLRANVFEMFLAVHFYGRGPCLYPEEPDRSDIHRCPFLTSVEQGASYGRQFSDLIQDTPTLALLLVVILLCPDAADPRAVAVIESHRMRFCRLLGAHLTARWGAQKGALLFPKLLLLLPTLREIRDKRLFYRLDIGHRDFTGTACATL